MIQGTSSSKIRSAGVYPPPPPPPPFFFKPCGEVVKNVLFRRWYVCVNKLLSHLSHWTDRPNCIIPAAHARAQIALLILQWPTSWIWIIVVGFAVFLFPVMFQVSQKGSVQSYTSNKRRTGRVLLYTVLLFALLWKLSPVTSNSRGGRFDLWWTLILIAFLIPARLWLLDLFSQESLSKSALEAYMYTKNFWLGH